MLTAISDPIERLASLRDELQDAWVTFDRSSLQFFQTIFTRIDGAVKMFTTRRTLPGQKLWDAFPRLTMLVSNGFVIAAEKVGTRTLPRRLPDKR